MSIADTHEPDPVPNDRPAVWSLVIADMQARDAEGRRKYGTPLQPHNGRNALVDAYQEGLDLVVYLRQAIEERGTVAWSTLCSRCRKPLVITSVTCGECCAVTPTVGASEEPAPPALPDAVREAAARYREAKICHESAQRGRWRDERLHEGEFHRATAALVEAVLAFDSRGGGR